MKSKAPPTTTTLCQNKKIEPKRIETSFVSCGEDIDEDSIFSEIVKNDQVQSLLAAESNSAGLLEQQ